MNTANYNKYPRYPLSIESLNFIQEQIKLIYNISDLYGTNYILRLPTTQKEGILVKDGEVLPINPGAPLAYIAIDTTFNRATADGDDYPEIETIRTARYTSVNEGSNCYPATDFEEITSISQIKKDLKTTDTGLQAVKSALSAGPINPVNDLCKHLMPKGSIIMWSGETAPDGWVFCNSEYIHQPSGVKVPNLSGRFIMGHDESDAAYSTIGNNGNYKRDSIRLDSNHLPEHKHDFKNYYWIEAIHSNDEYNEWKKEIIIGKKWCSKGVQEINNRALYYKDSTTNPTGLSSITPIDIRPSYFVLAYIIKVI